MQKEKQKKGEKKDREIDIYIFPVLFLYVMERGTKQ